MKNFNQFINESELLPEDEINNILDKNKKLDSKDKKKLKKLAKKDKIIKKKINPDSPSIFNAVKFNITDTVIYNKENSEHNGKEGMVLRTRKDGKIIIRFEDGSRLASSPQYLIKKKPTKSMKKLDPYNEEDWG